MEFDTLLTPIREAVHSFQRRLLVLAGRKGEEAAPCLIEGYWRLRRDRARAIEALYVGGEIDEGEGLERLARFKGLADRLDGFKLRYTTFKESQRFLGVTFDLLILDLYEDLTPNDVGVLVEIVRGGGLIFFLTPPFSEWRKVVTSFQRKLVSLPGDYGRLRRNFIEWVIRKLEEHRGIWIYDPPTIHGEPLAAPIRRGEKLVIPADASFPRRLYELCLTRDQIQALQCFESFLEKRKRKTIVVVADRGRGKSSVLGLAASGLLYLLGEGRPLSVKLTAPTFSGLEPILKFAKVGLESLGIPVDEVEVKGLRVALKCDYGVIDASSPYRIAEKKADIVFVDEAAGIPIPLLFKIMRRFRLTAFSSTIHGYEGAGRGFGLRFLKALEEDRRTKTIRLELKTPIRYSINDPIEAWLYDTLLLNAEPPSIDGDVNLEEVAYEKPNLEEWFTSKEKERELKEFVGICVLAHYRNRPNDFAMLADAPHHYARVLKLSQGVVGVLHLAEEGGLPDEMIDRISSDEAPPGEVIPHCIIKHYIPFKFFGKQAGLRVVRIAIHPKLEGRGLGSTLLSHLSDEATEEGYDWIGAGFGATIPLLSFWVKNGYIPVHLSPSRNAVSGEFSTVVIKPLTLRAEKLVLKINQEFKLKLVDSLFSTYFSLNPKLARLLFTGVRKTITVEPKLTKTQKKRVLSYVRGILTYEAAADSVKRMAEAHFMSSDSGRVKIEEHVEAAVIAKCLQGKNWSTTAKLSSLEKEEIKNIIREAIKRMAETYVKE